MFFNSQNIKGGGVNRAGGIKFSNDNVRTTVQRDHRPSAPGKAGRVVHVFSEVVKKALFIDN